MVVWTWYGHSLFGGMDGGMDMVWHGLNGVRIDFKLFKWTTQIKFKCLLLCQEGLYHCKTFIKLKEMHLGAVL